MGIAITVVSMLPPRGTPGPQIADLGEVIATIGHVGGYLLLGGLIILAQRYPRPMVVWAVVSVYGALIEVIQGALGLRSFQWTDILANALGAAIGIGLAMVWRHRRFSLGSDAAVEENA